MRKKLTVLGVLSALTLGAASLFGGGSASAGTGGPIQNFDVNNSICYGSAPAGTFPHSIDPACPGTSATLAPASSAAATHQMTILRQGSRLSLPIIYTPTSFGFTPGAVSATVGNVTSLTDLLCDGSLDILAGGPDAGDPVGASGSESAVAPWPDSAVWKPYPFVHKGVTPADLGGPAGIDDDAYVTSIKPTPSTFTAVSHDKANLYTLWLGKTGPLFLPSIQGGLPTPLNTVTETSPYAPLRVSVTMLAGNPNPPTDSFLTCLDSPQNSLAENTQVTTPGVAGLYPRWTAYTSAIDERGGNVSRVIDLNCVSIGGALIPDTDADCIEGGGGDLAGADSDGDFLQDGIEAANGTNPGNADTDGDGATDFDELFQFTNPNVADTDGDGSADKQDNGSDEVLPGSAVDDTVADDNCPADANASQANSDYVNDYNGVGAGDPTNPSQDANGDACDADDDNDRMSDAAEGKVHIILATTNFCRPNNVGSNAGAVLDATSPTDPDEDDDLGLDGAECKFNSNPQDFASRMAVTAGDNLADGGPETFYRTQKINLPGGGQLDNPDGDAFATGDADSDSDNDRLTDGAEVKFYGTHPSNDDTDNDGCKDGIEAASVNGDRIVSSIDLSQVAARFGAYTPSAETSLVPAGRVNYDYTKDRNIAAADLSQVAANFGPACPNQAGLVIVKGNTVPLP